MMGGSRRQLAESDDKIVLPRRRELLLEGDLY
jgi:hypothetical protein